ncbi:hypothetical protein B0I35DRAFT_264027 [Stachybotrys elegans]|uniref:Uncharacterized protein n=1 Tax=Stachybotrys elegans TaxID=80388 RepID=A0A8K0SPZ4_9HYPO|nr:hypothetical protein B0I35DRAFT_264027 [Stachybotrys elegans]
MPSLLYSFAITASFLYSSKLVHSWTTPCQGRTKGTPEAIIAQPHGATISSSSPIRPPAVTRQPPDDIMARKRQPAAVNKNTSPAPRAPRRR